MATLFASAAFAGALVETAASGRLTPVSSECFFLTRQLIGAFVNVFAIRMAGVFIMSSSTIMLRTGIPPRWVAFAGFSCAVVLVLAITNWPWIALLFPCWMLLVSTHILLAEFRRGGI